MSCYTQDVRTDEHSVEANCCEGRSSGSVKTDTGPTITTNKSFHKVSVLKSGNNLYQNEGSQ